MKRAIIFLGLFLIIGSTVWADVPKLMNLQGVLKDTNGNPVADGIYPVKFEIFDAVGPAGGCLWSENQSVTVQGGLFSVLLGSASQGGIPDSAFNSSARWLAITIGNDPEMTPRQQLSSVGYSFVSGQWNLAGDNIYRLNGNVGIGTNNPTASLEVAGDLKVNGNILGMTPWSAFPFSSGYTDYGGSFQTVQYRKIGDIVYLRELVRRSDNAGIPDGAIIGTIPVGFRPPARLIYDHNSYRVDVDISGDIILFVAPFSSIYKSLDGISFSVTP